MNKNELKHEVLEMRVQRIKLLNFFMNEPSFKPNGAANVQLDYKTGYNTDLDFFDFTLRIRFDYPGNPEQVFISAEVQNVFVIKELNRFLDEKTNLIELPGSALVSIVSLAISHTRAILATCVAGSVFGETLVPLLDAYGVAKHFFGDRITDN